MWPFASSLRSELFRPFPNNVIAKNLIPILSRDFSTTPLMSRNSWKYSLKRKIGHYKEVAGMFFVPVFRGEHFIDKELNRRYLIDGLSSRNWCLVYSDRFTIAVHTLAMLLGLFIFLVLVIAAYDYLHNDHQFTFKFIKRLRNDWYELGIFAFIVQLAIAIVFLFIFSVQRLLLFRIYVNRSNSDLLRVHCSNGYFNRHWIDVSRKDIIVHSYFDEDYDSRFSSAFWLFLRSLRDGSIAVANGPKFWVNTDAIRSNQLWSYIIGEIDTKPSVLETLDLDIGMEIDKDGIK